MKCCICDAGHRGSKHFGLCARCGAAYDRWQRSQDEDGSIVDVIDPMPARSGPPDQSWEAWVSRGGDPDQRRWWFGGFALVLDDVEPLPFRPWPGALGLFEVPDSEVPR